MKLNASTRLKDPTEITAADDTEKAQEKLYLQIDKAMGLHGTFEDLVSEFNSDATDLAEQLEVYTPGDKEEIKEVKAQTAAILKKAKAVRAALDKFEAALSKAR